MVAPGSISGRSKRSRGSLAAISARYTLLDGPEWVSRPVSPPRFTGRLHLQGCRGQGALRRKSEEHPQQGGELLYPLRRRAPEDCRAEREGQADRLYRDPDGDRGARPRGEPDKAPPAALQRLPEGRQELPLHRRYAG